MTGHLLGCRRLLVLLAGLAAAAVGVTSRTTLPGLLAEPDAPRTRACLVAGCILATLLVLLLEPLLPRQEWMAARRLVLPRLGLGVVSSVGLLGGAGLVVVVRDGDVGAVGSAAALAGLGLLVSSASTLLGVLLPWVYVVSGLVFGYNAEVSGPVYRLAPWAWLVDPGPTVLPAGLAVFGFGLLVSAGCPAPLRRGIMES